MSEDYRLYSSAYKKYDVLTDLAENLKTIQLQDSLIGLALLPRTELNAIIKEIIDKEIQKENEEREKEIMKRKNLSEGNRFGNRNEQFGNNTSGGKWYFYNPATLSFGLSEFTKKWGKRKLEDDWRRKNKKSTKIIIEDSTSAEKGGVQNTKDPQFYLSQIPVSSKDFISAREKIANACYQAAIIYKYDLQKVSKSNEMLNKILKIIDVDTSFIPLTYYNLYINFKEQNLKKQAINMKEKLLVEYPNSVFSRIILNPNYLENQQDLNSVDDKEYEEVYTNLAFKNHDEILMKTSSLKEGDLKEKYTFIRAMSMLSKGDTTTTLNLLAEVKRGKDKNLSNYASTLVETLKDPSKLIESNREAVEKTPYKFNIDAKHFVIFILPRQGVDVSFLKTVISDYNRSSYSTEIFEINAMMMGMDYHILTVKFFENARFALNYCNDVVYSKEIFKELKKTEHFIMPITIENFQDFYVNKDINGYKQFFENNYLDEN